MGLVLVGKSKLRFASLLAWTVQTSNDRPVMRHADFNNLQKAKGHKSCVLSLNSSQGNKVPMDHCAFESCPQLHNIKVFSVKEVWVLLETLHTESETKHFCRWGRLLLALSQISASVEAEGRFCGINKSTKLLPVPYHPGSWKCTCEPL